MDAMDKGNLDETSQGSTFSSALDHFLNAEDVSRYLILIPCSFSVGVHQPDADYTSRVFGVGLESPLDPH